MNELDRFLLDLPCCACLKPIRDNGKHINNICLDRLIEEWVARELNWYPYWSNFFYFEFKGAMSIICDQCLEEKREILFAIRIDTRNKVAYYYDVNKFKKIPLCYKCIYFDRQFHRNTHHFKCFAKRKILEYVPTKRCKKFVDSAKAVEKSLLVIAKEEGGRTCV